MVQKAKFKLLGTKYQNDPKQENMGVRLYAVKLTDADNDESRYTINRLYLKDKVLGTFIEKINRDCDCKNEVIKTDSNLGKKIIEFLDK